MTCIKASSPKEGNIYEIRDLKSARDFLLNLSKEKSHIKTKSRLILTNYPGSTRYYGMRVIDRMFKILETEFPNQICSIWVNAEDDPIALNTAKDLGYKNIKY